MKRHQDAVDAFQSAETTIIALDISAWKNVMKSKEPAITDDELTEMLQKIFAYAAFQRQREIILNLLDAVFPDFPAVSGNAVSGERSDQAHLLRVYVVQRAALAYAAKYVADARSELNALLPVMNVLRDVTGITPQDAF